MKDIVMKVLKTLLVFTISAIVIYVTLTVITFVKWGNENQLFVGDSDISELDSEKIQIMGSKIGTYAELLEESLNDVHEEGTHSIAEFFDPLGFSVWSYMHGELYLLFKIHIKKAILLATVVTIAYIITTNKKMSNMLKLLIGYLGIMVVFPHILYYYYSGGHYSISLAYKTPNIQYFYIGYTLIFIIMFIANYKIASKIAKELNEGMKNKQKDTEK